MEGKREVNLAMTHGVFSLIKSALSGKPVPLPEGFDLEQVKKLVSRHQIQNLIYYGAVNCGFDPKSELMRELFSATCRYMYIDERQRWELEKIRTVFEENGIAYMPLKGVLMKPLYPRPDMRIMGDADILIRLDQYDKIRPLMQQLGFTEKLESDHELIWTKPTLYLELHKRVIPSYNKDYAAYFGDGWRLARPCGDVPGCYQMSDEDQMVYLFTHFAKHYRDGGIGIRHLTDLYVYRKAKPQLDEEYIENELKALQLDVFYKNVCATLEAVFEDGLESDITRMILKVILNSGLYGRESERVLASVVREKTNGSTTKQVRRKRWIEMVFPPYSVMREKYPILNWAGFLLPVMWIVRGFVALWNRPHDVRHQRKQLQMMTTERVASYEQALHAVGLAFNFEE